MKESFFQTFKKGVVYGVGFMLGSTIFAALLVSAFVYFFGDVPLIEQFIELVRESRNNL